MGYATQLRTTDLEGLIKFYVDELGYEVDFRYEDFYAGIKIDDQILHLKLVDDKDPGIDFVEKGGHLHLFIQVSDVEAHHAHLKSRGIAVGELSIQPWAKEFVVTDPQGHRIYFAD